MSASVVSLSKTRERLGFRGWSNQDVAEIYRVADTLRRAGLPVDCDDGQTDEGDPWYAFCNVNTGDVIVHFAYIDGHYIAEAAHLGVSFKGETLSDIVNQFLNSYPIVIPGQKSTATRVWMHPASGFVAFIATLYFLLEMSHSAEAREAASGITIEGEGGETAPGDDLDYTGDLAAYHREQMLRLSRHEAAGNSDGMRSVAISAAMLIAGVLMDWHRTNGTAMAFKPESILDAILTTSNDELADAIILALRDMAGFETASDAGGARSGDGASARTAYVVKADAAHDAGLVGEDGQLIDVDGQIGDPGRAIGAQFPGDVDIGADGAAAHQAEGAGVSVAGKLADTIAVSVADEDLEGKGGEGQETTPEAGSLGSSDNPNFLDAAPQSSTTSFLESLGLKSGTSGLEADSDVVTVVQQLIAGISVAPANDDAGAPSAPPESDTDVSPAFVDNGGSAGPVSTGSGPSEAADTSDATRSTTPSEPSPSGVASDSVRQLHEGGSESDQVHNHDFSFFDPLDVLRLFVQTVDKVGFVHLDEVFYLYDAVAIATEPEVLEYEQLQLANGDEVNLIGQAETFDAIFDALT